MPSLIIQEGGGGTTAVPLDRTPVTLGCDGASDIALDGRPVSPRHATLRQEHARWYVKDEGSRYGTFVNDRRVAEQGLKDGDVIELGLGGPTVRFEAEEDAAAPGEEPITLEQVVPEIEEQEPAPDFPKGPPGPALQGEPAGPTTGVFRSPLLDDPGPEDETTVELDAPAPARPPAGFPTRRDDRRDADTTMELEVPPESRSRLRSVGAVVGAIVLLAAAGLLLRSCGTAAAMEPVPGAVPGVPSGPSASGR